MVLSYLENIVILYGCLLTFCSSTLISEILLACHEEGKQFSVVVVDSRPRLEGRETLRLLCKEGIRCKYIFINSVSYIMKEVIRLIFVTLQKYSLCELHNGNSLSSILSVPKTPKNPILVSFDSIILSSSQ